MPRKPFTSTATALFQCLSKMTFPKPCAALDQGVLARGSCKTSRQFQVGGAIVHVMSALSACGSYLSMACKAAPVSQKRMQSAATRTRVLAGVKSRHQPIVSEVDTLRACETNAHSTNWQPSTVTKAASAISYVVMRISTKLLLHIGDPFPTPFIGRRNTL